MFKIKKPVFRSPQRADNDIRDWRNNGDALDMGESGGIDRGRDMGKAKVKVSRNNFYPFCFVLAWFDFGFSLGF